MILNQRCAVRPQHLTYNPSPNTRCSPLTPDAQERVAFWVFAAYSVGSSMAVNLSFLSTHSMASSFVAAFVLRVLPVLILDKRLLPHLGGRTPAAKA